MEERAVACGSRRRWIPPTCAVLSSAGRGQGAATGRPHVWTHGTTTALVRIEVGRLTSEQDYGTTTLLFSVPITALHIWSKQEKWQPVKYNPGALVVNIGEALEIISGGHFKATKHKVTATPADQEHLERLSLVQFNASLGDLRLAPAVESPLLQREGYVLEQGIFQQYKRLIDVGVPVPTNKQWREVQVSTRSQIAPEQRSGGVQTVEGVKYGVDEFFGVKVLLPV